MTDSCRARKLDPGFAQAYSRSRERSTSTMKSDPQCSVVNASTSGGAVVSARGFCSGAVRRSGGAGVAFAPCGPELRLAAPAAAAPLRKFRRVEENFRALPMTCLQFCSAARLRCIYLHIVRYALALSSEFG